MILQRISGKATNTEAHVESLQQLIVNSGVLQLLGRAGVSCPEALS